MRSKLLMILFIIGQTTSITAVECPSRCNCDWVLDSLNVNCSHLDLIDLPRFSDLPIEILDLSHNKFFEFPTELVLIETLTSLDLSNNFIQTIPSDALLGFTSLRQLYLRENNISNWADIHPNHLLMNTKRIEIFSLSANPIKTFSSNDQSMVLISSSLKTLDLSFCQISQINGNFALQGMDHLEILTLAGNPLQSMTKLDSRSLRMLNLSSCEFRFLQPTIFSGLQNLIAVDLSKNSMLTLEPQGKEYAYSISLKRINLSYCNMPSVDLRGFPNVTKVLLKGNMLREVSDMSFRLNSQIDHLDLSNNAITVLELNAFSNLGLLTQLDLSFNMIAEVDRNVFSYNEKLKTLNLSRNFLTKFSRILGTSILNLDLSHCEISSISADALVHMPIIGLNLANNLISSLPDGFASQTLQTMDLSLNRISTITNITFRNFPELASLNLAGNRFTTPFRAEYFRKNQYLHTIGLEDNPWRCDCRDATFKNFFLYLTQTPSKIPTAKILKCNSPESSFGRTWDSVCFTTWFPQQNMSSVEKFWAVTLSIIAIVFLTVFTYRLYQKFILKKKQRRNAAQLRENVEEQRRIQLLNRQIIQQSAPLNAPDPRESNPPSYEVALTMPPLKRLTKSYIDITVKASNENLDQPDGGIGNETRTRYHSDNALLNETTNESTAKIRRTPSFKRNTPRSRRGSRLVAVRPPKCPDPNMKPSESLGKMSNFVKFDNSPYTRRKPRSVTTSSVSPNSSIENIPDEGPSSVPLRNNSLDFIENYYVRPRSISSSGEEYEMVSSESDNGSRKTSLKSSITSTDVGIVIVHKKPPSDHQGPTTDESPASLKKSETPEESRF